MTRHLQFHQVPFVHKVLLLFWGEGFVGQFFFLFFNAKAEKCSEWMTPAEREETGV